MVLKLKVKPVGPPQSQQDGTPQSAGPPATPIAASPAPSTASTGFPKLKLKASQPTPATEQPASTFGAAAAASTKKAPAPRKPTTGNKKRSATDDINPAAKRIVSDASIVRKPSLKLKSSAPPYASGHTPATPHAAGGLNKIKFAPQVRKQSTARIKALTTHSIRRDIPKRETGVGYDSEDSEREEDPAIQQGIILRMQPGEDAELLRKAITNGQIGVKPEEGGVDASIRFVTTDLRRACVRVRERRYAAVLVDLPCIIESMKSWDKKGWWKVSDVCQMLLVLGEVKSEAEIRDYPLPREVNKENYQFAHGLTPPMHYVRKRRFRKRVNHRQLENVEEEVERLMREDEEWERQNGKVAHDEYSQAEWERKQRGPADGEDEYDDEMDAEGDLVETTEGFEQQYVETPQEMEDDTVDLEADLANAFAMPDPDEQMPLAASDLVTDSPAPPLADQTASFAAVENAMMADTSTAPTPAETPAETPSAQHADPTSDEDDDESDESSSDDEPDVIDEDAAIRAAEKQQQLEEVADLEREIAAVRAKANAMGNQLLKKRELDKLGKLEGDLRVKRSAFGLDGDGDGEGEE